MRYLQQRERYFWPGKLQVSIPANIHEVLIVGKTENAPIRYLREALKQRNREMGIQQMLSDHVYEYSGRDKKLKRCLDEKKKNRER